MIVREFYDMRVGNIEIEILDSNNNILWSGFETIKNQIPELLQYTDIIKWSVDISKQKLILWVDEENM